MLGIIVLERSGASVLRVCIILLAIAGAVAGVRFSRAEDGATIIDIMWVEEVDRVSPDPRNGIRVTYRMELRLGADGAIAQSLDRKSAQFQAKSGATQTLGKEWRVAADNALYRDQEFSTHLRRFRIIVTGRTCTLAVSHELTNGHTEYVTDMLSRPGVQGRYSRIRAVNWSCSIRSATKS